MSKTTKVILIMVAIITTVFGAWPIGLCMVTIYIILTAMNENKERHNFEERVFEEFSKLNEKIKNLENQKNI